MDEPMRGAPHPLELLDGGRSFSSCVKHVIHTVATRMIIATTQNLRNWSPPRSRSSGIWANGRKPTGDERCSVSAGYSRTETDSVDLRTKTEADDVSGVSHTAVPCVTSTELI